MENLLGFSSFDDMFRKLSENPAKLSVVLGLIYLTGLLCVSSIPYVYWQFFERKKHQAAVAKVSSGLPTSFTSQAREVVGWKMYLGWKWCLLQRLSLDCALNQSIQIYPLAPHIILDWIPEVLWKCFSHIMTSNVSVLASSSHLLMIILQAVMSASSAIPVLQ